MHPGAVQDSVITTLLFELTNDSQAESRAYSLIRKLKPTYMYVHVSLYNNRNLDERSRTDSDTNTPNILFLIIVVTFFLIRRLSVTI